MLTIPLTLNLFSFYLEERGGGAETDKRDIPSTATLPTYFQELKVGQALARSLELSLGLLHA